MSGSIDHDEIIVTHCALIERLIMPLAFPTDGTPLPYPALAVQFYQGVAKLESMKDQPAYEMIPESGDLMVNLHDAYVKLGADPEDGLLWGSVWMWIYGKEELQEAVVKVIRDFDVREVEGRY
jgi:hypothetical protein